MWMSAVRRVGGVGLSMQRVAGWVLETCKGGWMGAT